MRWAGPPGGEAAGRWGGEGEGPDPASQLREPGCAERPCRGSGVRLASALQNGAPRGRGGGGGTQTGWEGGFEPRSPTRSRRTWWPGQDPRPRALRGRPDPLHPTLRGAVQPGGAGGLELAESKPRREAVKAV